MLHAYTDDVMCACKHVCVLQYLQHSHGLTHPVTINYT